jgi:hypothetical protein
MNLLLLFPFLIIVLLVLAVLIIYWSPLDLQIVMERTGTCTLVILTASWSVLTLKGTSSGGDGSLSLLFLGKKIIRRDLFRKSEVMKRPERVSRGYTGQDLVAQPLSLGSDMIRFLTAVFHHLTLRRIEGTFTVGLQNPADTGVLFGCFSAIRPLLFPYPHISISMRPVFDREILEGQIIADFRISRPLFIPVLMLRLAMKPEARRLIRMVSSHTAGNGG